ncbi:4'-phosphopantetheinyl transferase superfamily protein [Kitasatospora sp. NPDC002040]|uniref:4'-phosphopantetheinyl transferase family protein n=1 Tax=Kitasatospora sp. NPDC002040 TaxID=3154661 RepID=UPI003318FD72
MTPLAMVAGSAEVLARPDLGEHLLTGLERERAGRFRLESARTDFVAAHLLVRECAARLLGRPAAGLTLLQRCPDCARDDHGKPYLAEHPEVEVSLSHGRGVVAAAAGAGQVGVDVEQPARETVAEVMERVLSAGELKRVREHAEPHRAFLRLWVRKEAMVKLGRVTLDTLGELDLSGLELDGSPLRSRFGDLHLLDWEDLGRGATVGVIGTAEPRVEEL